jgi:hypothetical protein
VTTNDLHLIHAIADRAIVFFETTGMVDAKNLDFARAGIVDEIRIVHNNIYPLRLRELLAADDFNFMHDVAGIHRHLNYGTKRRRAQLNDCFVPRFAKV